MHCAGVKFTCRLRLSSAEPTSWLNWKGKTVNTFYTNCRPWRTLHPTPSPKVWEMRLDALLVDGRTRPSPSTSASRVVSSISSSVGFSHKFFVTWPNSAALMTSLFVTVGNFWGRRWGTLQRQLPLLLLKARKMDLYIYNWDTLTKRKRSATKNEKWSLSKWKCSRHSNSEMLFRNDIRNEIDICFHRFLKNYRFHFYMFGWISRINYQLWFDPIRTFFFQNLMMKITTHMIKFIRISHQSCLLRTKVPEHRHILQLPSKVFSGHVEQIIS